MNLREPNATHDPSLRSWVASANEPGTDFPIQNLPFGVFRRVESSEAFRGGVAIGDRIVDLGQLRDARRLRGDAASALAVAACAPLNDFAALGPDATHALREALSLALRDDAPQRFDELLVAMADAEYALPVAIGDYTDFYSSRYHAQAVGRLFRPDQPLLENYDWVPVGYHGRASSVVVSGTRVVWPSGQRLRAGQTRPDFGPSERLDYEVELGLVIGRGNALGTPIAIDVADNHIFGLCLLNDWSARDVQSWEYRPLGPFLGKSFATTISPWIVTLEALAPFRVPLRRAPDAPPPMPYLVSSTDAALDIGVEAWLRTASMAAADVAAVRLSHATYADACWTPAQLVAHHASNGCNLRAGDLLGTGTLSGPDGASAGSLLERSRGGNSPILVDRRETRTFLDSGDEITMRGRCEGHTARAIGFGTARGTVVRD